MEKKLQMLQQANLVDEALILLYYWVNKDDMEETFERNIDLLDYNKEDYTERYQILYSIYSDVKAYFGNRKERIEYFFKDRNGDFSTYATISILWNFHEYNNRLMSFSEVFGAMNEEQKVINYARLIDSEEFINTPKEKLRNFADLIVFLENSSYENEAKWEAIKIYNHQEAYYNEVLGLLTETIEILMNRHEEPIKKLEKAFHEYWTDYQKEKDIIETIQEKLGISWESGSAGTILLPHLFQPFSVSLSIDKDEPSKPDVIRIGIMMNERFVLTRKRIKKEDIVNVGKLLSDKSKVDILEFAGRKPCYGKELANELQLSTATISYHVNSLLKEGLLKAEVSANKVYYSLNRETLTIYFEDVKKYFLK
ncbi:MAG: transcriptional regulator, ArsR family [Herbinix sp.]|nr:transcriptional regulator, ArsR family [Herbinix sp.]